MKRRRLLSFLLGFLLLAGALLPVAHAANAPIRLADAMTLPEAPEIQAEFAILMELKSGTILYEKNARERAYPASTTKILTALLTWRTASWRTASRSPTAPRMRSRRTAAPSRAPRARS
nr:D-alanyl-D-alanine carboxypeptidase [Lachnospiraceae bacterium]